MYIQVIKPNHNIAYYGGYCEGYVEGTAGQATIPTPSKPVPVGVYGTAAAAWEAHPDHPGQQPPNGVEVALYFSLGSTPAGHTALWLGDGRVASSTQPGYHTAPYIHPSLQDLISVYAKNNNGCTYLGWSEWIGKLQVVKGDEMFTKEQVNILVQATGNTPATDDQKAVYSSEPITDVLNKILTSDWNIELRTKAANYDALQLQYDELKTQSGSFQLLTDKPVYIQGETK